MGVWKNVRLGYIVKFARYNTIARFRNQTVKRSQQMNKILQGHPLMVSATGAAVFLFVES